MELNAHGFFLGISRTGDESDDAFRNAQVIHHQVSLKMHDNFLNFILFQ